MGEVPRDFFVDIVSNNNFLATALNTLFTTVKVGEELPSKLKQKSANFEENVTKRFGWDFDAAPEDELPVVVEM